MDRDAHKYKQVSVIDQLDYSEGLTHLLNKGMKIWSLYSVLYYSVFGMAIGIIGFHIYELVRSSTISEEIIPMSIGIVLGLVSVIPHELIHALVYKMLGATDVKFLSNWKKLYFTTSVDKYVITKNEFITLALSPFVVILSIALLSLYIQSNLSATMFFVLIHISICKGDFAMINILIKMNSRVKYIFTDTNLQKIYFIGEN